MGPRESLVDLRAAQSLLKMQACVVLTVLEESDAWSTVAKRHQYKTGHVLLMGQKRSFV
jgi:hypothetical protein